MTQLPTALVDFADAIKTLVASQSDVTQLVTKWDEIVNTTTPNTVKIVLSDGTEHIVDNLAKIREDLVEGLSLDKPTVSELNFASKYGAGGQLVSSRYVGYSYYSGIGDSSGASEDPFDKYSGYSGFVRALKNDFFTQCAPNRDTINCHLLELPRVVWLGIPDERNNNQAISSFTMTVTAPPESWLSRGGLVGRQYYGLVTFLNASVATLGDITLNIIFNPGDAANGKRVFYMPEQSSITLLFFAYPGQDRVNVWKIGEGQIE